MSAMAWGLPYGGPFARSEGLGSASRGARAAGTLLYLQDEKNPRGFQEFKTRR